MKKRKLPYIIRYARLALKCTWNAIITPYDPFYSRKVNFWNIPVGWKIKHSS